MKKIKLLSILLILFTTHNVFSQIGSAFEQGFYKGYDETLSDEGLYEGRAYADPANCETNITYDPSKSKEKVEVELFNLGYRCGVKQASKAIPKIKNANSIEHEKRMASDNNIGQQNSSFQQQRNSDQFKKHPEEQRETKRHKTIYHRPQYLKKIQQQQIQQQQQMHQSFQQTLNSLASSLRGVQRAAVEKELRRRQSVTANFVNSNTNRIKKIKGLYDKIPTSNFNKKINGQFEAYMFLKKKYSFLNAQELYTQIPCLIKVKDNKVVNIYPYGKKGFELDYPKNMESKSFLANGIVEYINFSTLETITIVLIEPYLTDNPNQYEINKKGTGFITLYTSKKKDEGRTVWVQEIDNKGNIVREISTPLVYAENDNDLAEMNIEPLPFNTDHELYYFGEPVATPYGRFPLYMKTSKSDTKQLEDNENRIVKIKKYRD